MSFETHIAEDRRLQILILLSESAEYAANEFLLQTALEQFGHAVSQDRLRSDLAWLAEQALLTIDDVGTVQVARLNTRGGDVAAGRAVVPGVKRRKPRG